jgi:hypothetical protein
MKGGELWEELEMFYIFIGIASYKGIHICQHTQLYI